MVPRKVGEHLRRRRLQLGLKQLDVAEALGVSRAYVGAIENGVEWEPDAEKLVGWAVLLDLDPGELLRSLGRTALPTNVMPIDGGLSPAMAAAIRRAVAEGVREGLNALHAPDDMPGPPRTIDAGRRPSRR